MMAVSYKKLWHILLDRDMKKRDLQEAAGLTKYAMNNSDFLNIVSKSEHNMFGDERDPVITTNHMIDRKRGGKYYLPFVKGIKTGYVEQAGRCLISYAVKDGKT